MLLFLLLDTARQVRSFLFIASCFFFLFYFNLSLHKACTFSIRSGQMTSLLLILLLLQLSLFLSFICSIITTRPLQGASG